jgi:hypothetical protein
MSLTTRRQQAAHRGWGMGAAPWQAGAIVLVSGALLAAAQQWQASVPPAAGSRSLVVDAWSPVVVDGSG